MIDPVSQRGKGGKGGILCGQRADQQACTGQQHGAGYLVHGRILCDRGREQRSAVQTQMMKVRQTNRPLAEFLELDVAASSLVVSTGDMHQLAVLGPTSWLCFAVRVFDQLVVQSGAVASPLIARVQGDQGV